MRKLRQWSKATMLAALLIPFVSCEKYDPYKNPPPPPREEPPREPREPRFTFPVASCSRQEPPPSQGSPGGGKPGWGCTSPHDSPPRPPRTPRHQRQRPPRQGQNEDGPLTPCPDHIFPFCTDENPFGVTYRSGTTGYGVFPRQDSIGCLLTAPCPTWFYMRIEQPGDLLIYIEQKGAFGKLDVDFACWGPFEATSKRDFLDKLCGGRYTLNTGYHPNHRPADGDHQNDTGGYPFGNLVDCSFDEAGTEWCYIPSARTGEWYLLLLTNYSRKKGKIHFDRVDRLSTATTDCKVVVPITLNPVPKDLRRIDDHTSAICLYDDTALVSIELETDEGYTMSRATLRKCIVDVHANRKSYRASLEKDHFECKIDIESDTTEYYVSISCPDPEFYLDTETYSIVRSTDCDPDDVEFTEGGPHYAGDLTVVELVEGDKPVVIDCSDPYGIPSVLPGHPDIDIDDYDVTVDFDGFFIRRVDIEKKRDIVELTPQIRGDWCDCFVPDTLTLRLRMVPNNGDISATPYEVPIKIGIVHKTVWIGRCLWVLMLMGTLILLILYLLALMRKKRFKKNAVLTPVYYNSYGEEVDDGAEQNLRKPGFPAWFSRWLLPGREKNKMYFSNPACVLTVFASDSVDVVDIPKKSIDPETMDVDGYDPQNDATPSHPAEVGPEGRIYIHRSNGKMEGYLVFTPGDKIDGDGLRMFLGILVVASALALGILAVLLIRGLL